MILGIDIGSTSTDAVLLDGGHVAATAKVPSHDGDPVASFLAAARAVPAAARSRVGQVALGLRAAAGAVAARRGLGRVGVLRIGTADAVRPLYGWPADLREAVLAGVAQVAGGGGLGPGDARPLDRDAVARFGDRLAGHADAFAVSAVFAPADGRQEREAAEILRARTDVPVLLSGEVGPLGLVHRENATVLDAALSSLVDGIADRVEEALPRLGLAPRAAVFVTRHDGTLMTLDYLRRQPGLSLGSGPACTLRGAGLLAGSEDAVVADIGARRARVGTLTGGYPQVSGTTEHIGGVPVNLRFPDLITVDAHAHRDLAEAADRMRPGAGRFPLILVGGGADDVPDVPGFDVVRPPHGAVAGAFGAAASPVGGHHERIVRPGTISAEDARAEVVDLARAGAVRAGADPQRLSTVLEPDLPVPYLPGAVLIRARAAGPPLPL